MGSRQKNVLITGCSHGGIGAALAVEFHIQGCRVFATARDPVKMATLAAPGIDTLPLDVDSETSIAEAVAAVHHATASDGGVLDILVNNAAQMSIMPFLDTPVADFRRVMETNVIAVFAVTQAFMPLLMRAHGLVASVGSISEIFVPPYQVAYNASKAAVHTMSDTLRPELAPFGVRFVTLATGTVRTNIFDNCKAELPEGSLYTSLKSEIEGRTFFEGHRSSPEQYAKDVVAQLLKPKPKKTVWVGTMSTVAWLLSCLGWSGMFDSIYAKKFGLDRISA